MEYMSTVRHIYLALACISLRCFACIGFFFALSVLSSPVHGADSNDEPDVSIVCFKGMEDDSERADVYVSVPYQRLHFVQTSTMYLAEYSVRVVARTIDGERVCDRITKRRCSEARYDITRGSTGKADVTQTVCTLGPGEYVVTITVEDALSHGESTVVRRLRMPSYSSSALSISSILIASALEQRGDRFRITPYVHDNVSALDDGFFVFFETYNAEHVVDSVTVISEIVDNANRVERLVKKSIDVRDARAQHYMHVRVSPRVANGSYVLRTYLLDRKAQRDDDTTLIMSRSERPIVIQQSVHGVVVDDIDKAIRRMRYVAPQSEIDSIRAASTPEERRTFFAEYWRRIDPTPSTLRNEAFEEYYGRIEYAEKNFRSYNEGWLTDMGMVYIVLGPPTSTTRRTSTVDGTVIVEWIYMNGNRRFVFIDYNSFGDFRLSTSTPFSSLEKYTYRQR